MVNPQPTVGAPEKTGSTALSQPAENSEERREMLLDAALSDSFPASDPIQSMQFG
jgi:hypothetical protein